MQTAVGFLELCRVGIGLRHSRSPCAQPELEDGMPDGPLAYSSESSPRQALRGVEQDRPPWSRQRLGSPRRADNRPQHALRTNGRIFAESDRP
eukprot:2754095-Rhodomonas_salina.5